MKSGSSHSFARRIGVPCFLGCVLSLVVTSAMAQTATSRSKNAPSNALSSPSSDITGMYSFLKEGEFVQITVDNDPPKVPPKGKALIGYISRFGSDPSDDGQLLDHFFSRGSLDGSQLAFATKQIHGIWFDFEGTVGRGPARTRTEDGYFVVRGTLTQHTLGKDRNAVSKSRQITLKLLPELDEESRSQK